MVYRRIRVELDSMGEMTAGVGNGDAMVDDVADPLGDLLAPAMQSAYIEVVVDGTGPRTGVAFDGHIPDRFTGWDEESMEKYKGQINAQGALGRDSTSTQAGWKFYAQGGYEGFLELDEDPDTEEGLAGITNRDCGKYSLTFMETVRDLAAQGSGVDEAYLRAATVAHELAHQFGERSEGGGGIMDRSTFFAYPFFAEQELYDLRAAGVVCEIPGGKEW